MCWELAGPFRTRRGAGEAAGQRHRGGVAERGAGRALDGVRPRRVGAEHPAGPRADPQRAEQARDVVGPSGPLSSSGPSTPIAVTRPSWQPSGAFGTEIDQTVR